jgi:hypothetical protein
MGMKGDEGDEGDGCRVVDGSVISNISHHLPISLILIYIKMKSCQENKILVDSGHEMGF